VQISNKAPPLLYTTPHITASAPIYITAPPPPIYNCCLYQSLHDTNIITKTNNFLVVNIVDLR